MGLQDLDIAIVGAGIGGLTAALALQRFGFTVQVFEQAEQLAEVGAGLTISPNATHALDALGLADDMARLADIPTAGAVADYKTGETMLETYRGDRPFKTYGAHYYQIHRADLHALLAEKVRNNDPSSIHTAHMFVGCEQTSEEVAIRFANGAGKRCDVLVGCDGGASRVRSEVFAPEPVVFTGQVAFRALTRASAIPEEVMMPPSKAYIGPDRLFTRYYIRKRTEVNVVALGRQPGWEEEGWTIPAEKSELHDLYREFHDDVHTIIDAIPDGHLYKWALRDRSPRERWTKGRVVMLGDAAHPMTPFLGQGAAMAIEDGLVLGRCFAAAESVEEALRRYEIARKDRANGVQLQSRQQAELYQGSAHKNYHPGRNAEGRGLFNYNPATVPV